MLLKCKRIALIFINLGIYTDSWDARSIWIFKSKQIYYESSVLFPKNNYAQFSHPDYPNIAPAFSAAIVELIGYWNEIFPKLGFTLLFIPGLIFISKYFKENDFLIILLLTTFVVGKYFVNGELDGLVSIYFVSCALIIYRLSFFENKINHNSSIYLGFSIILTFLKLEGFVLLLSLIFSSIFYMVINKKNDYRIFLLYFISILPIVAWNIFTFYYQINNSNTEYAFSIKNFFIAIQDINNFILITKFLILNEKFLLSVVFFIISIIFFDQLKIQKFIILICLIYLCLLYFVYLSTPLNIEWHLNSSANRVIKPLSLLLFTFGAYNVFIKKN